MGDKGEKGGGGRNTRFFLARTKHERQKQALSIPAQVSCSIQGRSTPSKRSPRKKKGLAVKRKNMQWTSLEPWILDRQEVRIGKVYSRPQSRRFSWIMISEFKLANHHEHAEESGARTVDGGHDESDLRGVGGTGEMGVDLLGLVLVQ